MSYQQLNQVLGRAVMDQAFRHKLLSDPAGALKGFDLTPGEIDQLSHLDPGQFARLGSFLPPVPPIKPGQGNYDWVKLAGPDGVEIPPGPPVAPGQGNYDWVKLLQGDDKIEDYFNPKEYKLDKDVSWEGGKSQEGDAPELEFTSGEGKPLEPDVQFDAFEPGQGDGKKRRRRTLVIGGLLLLSLLACVGLALAGIINIPGLTPPHSSFNPVPVEDLLTASPELTEVFGPVTCGQICADSSSCAMGLACAPDAAGASVCARSGHCGCGVACDPSVSNTCDAGLSCTLRGGSSMCWAGGCESTPTVSRPTEVACQNPAPDGSCSQPSGGGGKNNGNVCSCKCKTTCIGNTCRTLCRDCNGNSC